MNPKAGDKVYDVKGDEWEVYLEEVMVPCVRLRHFNGEHNVYQDIPCESFKVLGLK